MKKLVILALAILIVAVPANAFCFSCFFGFTEQPNPQISEDSDKKADFQGSDESVDFQGSDTPVDFTGTDAPVDFRGSDTPTDFQGSDEPTGFRRTGPIRNRGGINIPKPKLPPIPFFTPFNNPIDFNPPIPMDLPARWKQLTDVTIHSGVPDNTIIYKNLALQCEDPDSPVTVKVASTHKNFKLGFIGFDLVIYDLDPFFEGIQTITLDCNGIKAGFDLTITEDFRQKQGTTNTATSQPRLETRIDSIRIPTQYDLTAPTTIPVTIQFTNTGKKKLKDVKVTALIPELGQRDSSGPADLNTGSQTTRVLLLDIPAGTPPGFYYIRILIHSSEDGISHHRILHREIEVIA